jgi:hypothetical protein
MEKIEDKLKDANQGDSGQRKSDTIPEEFIHNFNSGIIKKSEYFDLFISYKRDNGGDHGQKLAIELHEKLTADGYKVWLDNEEIGFSNNFEQRIEEAILHSKKVACILSPSWVESPNCRFEVQKAIEFEKRIIPIHYQEFRDLLKTKKNQGDITQKEWDRIDKPQEINFSSKDLSRKGYEDLKAVCDLKDEITAKHNSVLCESYYWKKYDEPKSMLLFGTNLTKVKRLRSQCNSDDELPNFTNFQDEYIAAAEKFVSNEVSTSRQTYISYCKSEYEYASELNFELKLQGIKTWFDEIDEEGSEDSFADALMNCENVIAIISDNNTQEDDLRIAYTRAQNKRILKVTDSQAKLETHRLGGEKNIYLWNDQLRIDDLITTINGDGVYNAAHSKLLQQSFEWEKSEKNNNKLLPLKEANSAKEWYQLAEKEIKDPQPNLSMINFSERSVANAETLRNRKKGLIVTGILGVLLIVIFGSIAYLANVSAATAMADAEEANASAATAMADAEEANASAATAMADAEEANASATTANANAAKAIANFATANDNAEEANANAEQANADAAKAEADAATANAGAEEATALAVKERAAAEEAKAAAAIANADAKKAKKKTLALTLSSEAFELTLDGKYDAAKEKADMAVAQYDSINKGTEDFETDILYETYSSILSKTELTKEDLIFQLKEEMPVDSIQHTHCLYASDSDFDWVVVKNVRVDSALVFSVTYTNNKEYGAFGLKNGEIKIFNAKDSLVIDTISVGTYRVTSMGYNSNGTKLVASTVDDKFTIIPLDSLSGQRNKNKQLIRRDSPFRIEEILFENDNTITAIGGKVIDNGTMVKPYKKYPATVKKLNKILN